MNNNYTIINKSNKILIVDYINDYYKVNTKTNKLYKFKFFVPGYELTINSTNKVITKNYNYKCPSDCLPLINFNNILFYCPKYLIGFFNSNYILNFLNKYELKTNHSIGFKFINDVIDHSLDKYFVSNKNPYKLFDYIKIIKLNDISKYNYIDNDNSNSSNIDNNIKSNSNSSNKKNNSLKIIRPIPLKPNIINSNNNLNQSNLNQSNQSLNQSNQSLNQSNQSLNQSNQSNQSNLNQQQTNKLNLLEIIDFNSSQNNKYLLNTNHYNIKTKYYIIKINNNNKFEKFEYYTIDELEEIFPPLKQNPIIYKKKQKPYNINAKPFISKSISPH